MPKLKFIGDTRATFISVPPGVTYTFRPGEEVELDAGFDYLAKDSRFKVLAAPKPSPPEEKPEGDDKKKKE